MTDTRAADSIILNCLFDLHDGSRSIIVDERSRELLTHTLRAVTEQDERMRFRSRLEELTAELQDAYDVDVDSVDELTSVVHRVRERLVDRGVEMIINHEFPVEVDPREAVLYSFSRSATVGPDQLVRPNGDEAVIIPVLAAWAALWHGEDEQALEYAEQAVTADPDSWTARQVALTASHKNPDLFRSGKLSASVYLRATTTIPESWNVTAAYRDDERSNWQDLGNKLSCLPLPRLTSESRFRLSFRGPVSESAELTSYHLSLGIVDEEYQAPRTTDRVLASGPTTAEASESVQLRERH